MEFIRTYAPDDPTFAWPNDGCSGDGFVEKGNSLRQVIINTHSPSVVMQVPEDSLLMAELVELVHDGVPFRAL